MHTLLSVFRSFSLLSVSLLSLLNLNFRAGYTFKSRMCRGIVGDVFQNFEFSTVLMKNNNFLQEFFTVLDHFLPCSFIH